MGLPDGALPDTPVFDSEYWREFEREAAHERQVWPAMVPCPGCGHFCCECNG